MNNHKQKHEAESAPRTSSPDKILKQVAQEPARYLPVDPILEIASTESDILLFDEADSLFGKRSDVKDSHKK